MFNFISKLTLLYKLRYNRKVIIIQKQIELIKKVEDVSVIKSFLDETPYVRPPLTKSRMLFYFIIVLAILTLFGINISPIISLLKTFIL